MSNRIFDEPEELAEYEGGNDLPVGASYASPEEGNDDLAP